MTAREMERLLEVLTEASPKSIFLEVAFMESWIAGHERRQVGIPLAMVEAALPFWEEEFRWKPRFGAKILPHPAWLRAAASLALFGVLVATQMR